MNQTNLFKRDTASKPKKNNQRVSNFIESIKELSSSLKKQGKDATLGVGQTAYDQLFGSPKPPTTSQRGELTPDQPFDFEEFLKSQERQTELRTQQRYEKQLKDERLVYFRKEEEAKLQIKSIQEELNKLAKATTNLNSEVKKAVFTAPVEPGVYYLSFFDRIRRIIELARKQIVESKTWFQAFNQRKRDKDAFYWGQVKKSGTKFMLSQERYMATQAG